MQQNATHCSTLQHTTTRCNTLQHAATRCNTLQQRRWGLVTSWSCLHCSAVPWHIVVQCRVLPCAAVCCSVFLVLQCVAGCCSVLLCVVVCCGQVLLTLHHITRSNTLQHTDSYRYCSHCITRCNTLHHKLQHTATNCSTLTARSSHRYVIFFGRM